MNVKPGQFIKLFQWSGYVRNVFKSLDSQVVIEILFAKDVARSNPSELRKLIDGFELAHSTADEFMAEIAAIRQGQDAAVRDVLLEADIYGKEQAKC